MAAKDELRETAVESRVSTIRAATAQGDASGGERSHPQLPARFQIKQVLGRGGAGAVYRVYDRTMAYEVALKVLHGVSVEHRLLLKNEFRALSNIVHPNIVDLYELVIDDRTCFFTMELVRGHDFASHFIALRGELTPEKWHERLRDAARQLALALSALHEGDKLHRDIKPTNVLVTDAGRVVLVDFGLAVSASVEAKLQREEITGTVLYMSPEQLLGKPLSESADWYSFGATLHEALAGVPPPRGFGQSSKKSLSARGFDVEPDLDELVLALLSPDENARPRAAEILARLGSRSSPDAQRFSSGPGIAAPELVGREAEITRLTELCMVDVLVPRVLRVLGPSGIGKSSVVRAVLEELQRKQETLVLCSRCHPQETVAFNAIDGLVDSLGHSIDDVLTPEERELAPDLHAALLQVFPVLGEALETSATSEAARLSDGDRRRLAFMALHEILRRCATRFRVVLWLDDLQWGDEDSGVALRQLLSDGPPLRLILSYRSEDENVSPCLRVLREDERLWRDGFVVAIPPLGEPESELLVARMVGDTWPGDPTATRALVRSAGGSPFLLNELGRYLLAWHLEALGGELAAADLEKMLGFRIRNLPDDCHTLLQLLATAGAPLEQRLLLSAAGLDVQARGMLTNLERLSILRTTDRGRQEVEFYHDGLREHVLAELTHDKRIEFHRALGFALLDTATPNPLAAVDQFENAGDLDALRRYVVAAANHAQKVLAFERAARLYRRAIELEPGDLPLHELYRRLGMALGSAGRGPEAAAAFTAAARLLQASEESRPEEVAQLHQRAAEQLIETGHFEEGIAQIRTVLTEVGVPLPRSRGAAIAMAAFLRVRSLITGYHPAPRPERFDNLELRRFDALWAACTRLAMVDFTLASYAAVRCAESATRLGEPSRMIRALAMEAGFSAIIPGRLFERRAQDLIGLADRLVADSDNKEYDALFVIGARVTIDFYREEFRSAWRQADDALAALRIYSPGRNWEQAHWQMWSLVGLSMNGELRELIQRVQLAREDAVRRDDRRVEQNICLGGASIAWLALDRAAELRVWADRALSFAPSTYSAQHYEHYMTMVDCDLYLDDGLSAWQRTVETWKDHVREGFLFLKFVRDDLLRCRGRAALAAALALRRRGGRRTADGQSVDKLLAEVERTARTIHGHGLIYGEGYSALLLAGLARAKNRAAEAVLHLERAVSAFDRGDMRTCREVSRYCLGQMGTQASHPEQKALAERWLREQGVIRPEAFVATLAPGLATPPG